jgi:exportin-2 (importin alpha re-exporter)
VRAGICEIAQLYALKYSDAFPQLGLFVEGVWRILSSVGMGTRDDHVSIVLKLDHISALSNIIQFVGRALGFLSVVVKMGSHKQLFEAQQTLEDFCRLIILPNMTIRREYRLCA